MFDLSDSRRRQLVYVAGFLYTLSLHKYVSRDPLSMDTGIQGFLEFGLMFAALALAFFATRNLVATREPRVHYRPSRAIGCFAAFGIFALASSWRSFNPQLSVAKGILLFVVLGMGYLLSQADLVAEFFTSVYWTYITTLCVGLVLGVVLPGTFPVWSVDEFTGRSRLSIFGTFPGTMGETAAYLILLAPVFFRSSSRGSYWISRLFLLFINLAAGGKLSSAVLLLLLGVEYLFKIQSLRSWRVVVLVNGVFLIVCAVFYVSVRGDGLDRSLGRPLEMIYGQDVAAEADSLDGRVDLWRGTGDLIIDNPVLGYGFDGARNVLMNIAEWSGSSHNGFLELALSGGAIGLVFFLVGLGAVFRACFHSPGGLRRRTLTVFAYMIFIAFTGVTFNFPSYFGFLILTLLFYRSVQFSAESVSPPAYLEITPPVAG